MATSTSDLASYINPKRHQDMQTDPATNLVSSSTNTLRPTHFNVETQANVEHADKVVDTDDLPAREKILTLSMLNEDNANEIPATGRISSAAEANRLREDLSFIHDQSTTIKEINGIHYQIALEDAYDFEDYAANFFKTHRPDAEIDLDDFAIWLANRRQQQAALVRTPNSAERRLLHGPYRDRLNATADANTTLSTSLPASTPKTGKKAKKQKRRSKNKSLTTDETSRSVADFYKKTKTSSGNTTQKGERTFKWVSLR